MGTADIITDILLIAFPIPIIVRSSMRLKRKISLVLLFSLSAIMIAVTGTRVPAVISYRGRQQYRTVWASCEILASAAVSNAIVLGSFIRDRGVKRSKYRRRSATDSIERAPTHRSMTTRRDSDEDLYRTMGYRIPPELRSNNESIVTVPSAAAFRRGSSLSSTPQNSSPTEAPAMLQRHNGTGYGQPPPYNHGREEEEGECNVVTSTTLRRPPPPHNEMSFSDVGGLLHTQGPGRDHDHDQVRAGASINHSRMSSLSTTAAHDFAPTNHTTTAPPLAHKRGSASGGGSGSRNLLSDLGGLLSPLQSGPESAGQGSPRRASRRKSENIPMFSAGAGNDSPGKRSRPAAGGATHIGPMDLQDPGGLLR